MNIPLSMFRKTLYTLTFLTNILIPLQTFAAGWVTVESPAVSGAYYRGLGANGETVIAFGALGSITSTNSGRTWNNEVPYSTSTSVNIEAGFVFGSRAIAVGDNGVIFLSTDSGASWVQKASPIGWSLFAIDGHYIAENNAYTLYASGSSGAIVRSIDGGETWTDLTIGGATWWTVAVGTNSNVWLGGDNGAVYKSVDGGSTWSAKDVSTSFDINAIQLIDNNNLWIAGEGEFIATTQNGGTTWTTTYPTDRNLTGEIVTVLALSTNEIYISRTDHCLWRTTNAGATWTSQNTACNNEYTHLAVSSTGQLLAAGYGSTKTISVYDTQAPTVGTISVGSLTVGQTGVLTVTATDNYNVNSCLLKVDGASVGTFSKQSDGTTFALSYAFPTSGNKTLSATCLDDANNSATGGSITTSIGNTSSGGSSGTSVSTGMLIKTACTTGYSVNDPCTAVYYLGSDGKRHAFTNDKVFFTWYTDFSSVIIVDASIMAAYQLGENVTYKPGITLVKFITMNTVFAVEKGGILHGISSESVAAALYGSDWNTQDVDDISDAFFRDYTIGSAITSSSDYNVSSALSSVTSINDNF